ncbi:Actin patches distal protein 1 [Ceratocystis platani]|uniref:Actin patches distal protein 1 n=1 Tax=Ceratocystis fimbriata f. sp. platani TaxID=88771 RepID=A0A0F8D9C4_CERFI|nr:Actin patches distal protein 1 [Ceratocystis platani]
MASKLFSFLSKTSLVGKEPTTTWSTLFPTTSPDADGDDCLQDCESCSIKYPKSFSIEKTDKLYGHIKAFSTHVLVATGKADWVRDVADEKGSIMQAISNAPNPSNGKLMLSASNMPQPSGTTDYSEPTRVLLLPAFVYLDQVTPANVPTMITSYINVAPTSTSELVPFELPEAAGANPPDGDSQDTKKPIPPQIIASQCPHSVVILMCSQKTRDARCGQSAPLLKKELERHLRPLGLYRDYDDTRPGGVGIYFISHVGGHKYSANMMIYRRPNAFGVDDVERSKLPNGEVLKPKETERKPLGEDVGAAQCMWLARVFPQDCENIVKYTVLQGKLVKPESQLRGGYDRANGLLSW